MYTERYVEAHIERETGKLIKLFVFFPLLKKYAGKLIKFYVTFLLLKKYAGKAIAFYVTFPLLEKYAGMLMKFNIQCKKNPATHCYCHKFVFLLPQASER